MSDTLIRRAMRRLRKGPKISASPRRPAPRPRPAAPIDATRLVAVTRVLDEADIIEAFVRHTAHFVAHHVFLDNGSGDGTLDILRQLAEEGFKLTVLQALSPSFREEASNTELYGEAVKLGAGWVLFLDTDEFLDDRGSEGLAQLLVGWRNENPDTLAIRVAMTTYLPTELDDPTQVVVPLRLRHRSEPSAGGKIILRGDLLERGVVVGAGNHAAGINGEEIVARQASGLVLAHYPRRSAYQFAAKCVKGWSKVLAAGSIHVQVGLSRQYEPLFKLLRDRPQDFMRDDVDWGGQPSEAATFTDDPIEYLGGPLRYTPPVDHAMNAVRSLVRHLELLSIRHGRMMEDSPEVRSLAHVWDARRERIL